MCEGFYCTSKENSAAMMMVMIHTTVVWITTPYHQRCHHTM